MSNGREGRPCATVTTKRTKQSKHKKIPNSKHQITNKSQIFTLWNPPEEGRQEAAFHRAGIK
jgi:hypothetical protein